MELLLPGRSAPVSVSEQLLHRNEKQFRGGLVFKAHRWLHHSTLGSRVTKEKKKVSPSLFRVFYSASLGSVPLQNYRTCTTHTACQLTNTPKANPAKGGATRWPCKLHTVPSSVGRKEKSHTGCQLTNTQLWAVAREERAVRDALLSHRILFMQSSCRSQVPHKFVNLFFLLAIKHELKDL